jgi:hypothetical protein
MQSMLSSWQAVARGYDDLLGVLVAVSFDSGKLSDTAEENLIKDYGVVGAVVKLRHLGVFRQANAKELVDRAAIFAVFARQLVRGADEQDFVAPLLSSARRRSFSRSLHTLPES